MSTVPNLLSDLSVQSILHLRCLAFLAYFRIESALHQPFCSNRQCRRTARGDGHPVFEGFFRDLRLFSAQSGVRGQNRVVREVGDSLSFPSIGSPSHHTAAEVACELAANPQNW